MITVDYTNESTIVELPELPDNYYWFVQDVGELEPKPLGYTIFLHMVRKTTVHGLFGNKVTEKTVRIAPLMDTSKGELQEKAEMLHEYEFNSFPPAPEEASLAGAYRRV